MHEFVFLSDGGVNLANVSHYAIGQDSSVTLWFGKDNYRSYSGGEATLILDALGHPKDSRTVESKPLEPMRFDGHFPTK